MSDWKAKLKALGPCPKAYRWAIKHKTLREAWRMCERYDWMDWLLVQCGELEVEDAISGTMYDVWEDHTFGGKKNNTEISLQDAYICLDFMPNPPRLPEIT